jgi:hypothetical protein
MRAFADAFVWDTIAPQMGLQPFYRRPGFRTGLTVVLLFIAYLLVRRSAGELPPPPAGLMALLGAAGTLAIFLAAGVFLPPARNLWDYPWQAVRLGLTLGWAALHAASLLPAAGLLDLSPTLAHIDLALATLLLMVSLTAQFVLPVRTLQERFAAVTCLLRTMVGQSGPVTFLHNGRQVESSSPKAGRGPGVLLADQASAAVLRDDVRLTQTVGPGTTFTAPGERVAEALDLRRQVRRISGQRPDSTEERTGQPGSTLAVTRDGIPVSADLSVTFCLDPGHPGEPRQGQAVDLPPFEFNPASASRAVYSGHAYGPQHEIPWTDLPVLLVIDGWREQAKARDLSQLFSRGRGQPSPLEEIQLAILTRLTSPTYESGDTAGRVQPRPSREYRVLTDRGIRVLHVGVSGLVLPEDIADELTLQWREHWSGAMHEVLTDSEYLAQEQRKSGQRLAYQALCDELTAGLRSQLTRSGRGRPAMVRSKVRPAEPGHGHPPNRRDTLATLLLDALRVCARPEMTPEGGVLAPHLRRMRTEVLNLDADCLPQDLGERP